MHENHYFSNTPVHLKWICVERARINEPIKSIGDILLFTKHPYAQAKKNRKMIIGQGYGTTVMDISKLQIEIM
ncbi:hypothetical protein D7Z94_08960 [Ulvibacterium marinum]|uniref:Uncharacterized protein n=1 Tax=Ulvibacterium marinum TaxID=2419782 RepID=A0A3B0CBT4_9FLAO|nr:hypothetical protein D7Z94_08960 [Ulvibacterium marinum]